MTSTNVNLKCITFQASDHNKLEEQINKFFDVEGNMKIVSCNYQASKLSPTSEYTEHFALIIYELI